MRTPYAIASPWLYLATAAWVASIPNAVTLAHFVASHAAGHGAHAAAFVLGGWLFVLTITFGLMFAVAPVARGRMARVVCVIVLVSAAAVSYFTTFLGTLVDKSMVMNVAQTHAAEALELVNIRLVAWILGAGVLPAVIAWRWPLTAPPRLRVAATGGALLVALLGATGALVYGQYSHYASAARNREITFATVAPVNFLGGAIHYAVGEAAAHTHRAPRGLDAHQAYAIPEPRLLLLVIGETARAANHGLNGYARDTTPRMRAAGGYYFPDTESCGTATAISVPCIFSGLTRPEFSLLKGRQNETLIDVVKRSGARVIWLDNDSGCKDVCSAAEYTDLTGRRDPRFCPEPAECRDAILLDGLERRLAASTGDTLVVLHLKGSHGPAYFKRYPPEFERFTPVCRTSDISACGIEELVNAYDNSILYTDYVVGESIDMLKRLAPRYAAALL
ncbi:MAG TPA: sulfatase-like hydrolase/transferase, partial [Usitatibacter sp.]|nr:sulfatase-like hydrolase/transferase [Usitatibacter sp.]